jgi:hypothetical protein
MKKKIMAKSNMDFAQYLHPVFGQLQVPINQFPNRNTGVIEGVRFTDWVAGKVSGIKYEVVNKTGDWRKFLPIGEYQGQPHFDYETFSCTAYSNSSSSEIQLKFRTGYEFNWSDRAMNVLAGGTRSGNYLYKPADAARNIGRVLESEYPDDLGSPANWAEFNKPLPPNLHFYRWHEEYEWVGTDRVSLIYHLRQAPLIITIPNPNPIHAAVLVAIEDNNYFYWDSYAPFLKLMTSPPTAALKLVVRPMSDSIFYHKKDSQQYGFVLPALSPDALKNLALLLGKEEIIKPDGTISFDMAKEITFNE